MALCVKQKVCLIVIECPFLGERGKRGQRKKAAQDSTKAMGRIVSLDKEN